MRRIRITELHPDDAFYDMDSPVVGLEARAISIHESNQGNGFSAGAVELDGKEGKRILYLYAFKYEEVDNELVNEQS